jgi:hypothetical protein
VSPTEFKQEAHRIAALLLRSPKWRRKRILEREIQRLPPTQRETALSFIGAAVDISEMTSSQKIQLGLAFAFGVVFLSVVLALAVLIPNPTGFQYQVFRITLALAAGGVAAVIPGIMNINISGFLTAGGALAVLAIVFFYSPALIPNTSESVTISLPAGATFRHAAELIGDEDGSVVEFRGFTEVELNVQIRPGKLTAADYKSLLDHLRFRADTSATLPEYTSNREPGKYLLVAAPH